MKWRKVVMHDLRRGLIRWRHFSIPLICLVCCLDYLFWSSALRISGSWMDIVFFIFQGQEPIDRSTLSSVSQFPIPIVWLLLMGACLYLNLDYFLADLSLIGQQIILRCTSRKKWFLSKCVWNLLSTALYFFLICLTALAFGWCIGSAASLHPTPEILVNLFGASPSPEKTAWEAVAVGLLLPFLTLSALNLLQMSLCVMVKPIVSFLLCVGVLLLSVYIPNGFILGNGAMVIRSELIAGNGCAPAACLITACVTMALSVALGAWRFSRMDILPSNQ